MDSSSRILKLALLADTAGFSSGLNKAQNQTKTFGQKVGDTAKKIGKAFAVAGVAIAGMAAKLAIDGVKAAIADEKAQVKLATTLKNTTNASAKQTKQVEAYIDKLQRASGVADDKLRPSLEKLLVATGKISKAQKLQGLAMDIAAGTGKDLDTVSLALAKAYNGNLGSLTRLGIKLDESIIKNKDFNAAQKELNKTFSGQSAAAADTMAGKFARFNIAVDEAKESIGVALMPTIEKMVNYLNSPKGQKVITDFAESFATAMQAVAKVLPGIIKHISSLVKKVGSGGISAVLKDDPALAAAALAYGAGFIAGGPTGGAIAALAAYAGGSYLQNNQRSAESAAEVSNLLVGKSQVQLDAAAAANRFDPRYGQVGGGYTGSNFLGGVGKIGSKRANNYATNNITVIVNGAADSRESARAIERTLKKVQLNGGSIKGIEGFN